jgi:DegV family protein with EDD domain
MRIGLVIDSVCDLPRSYIERNHIEILPITVQIGDAIRADHRDEKQTLEFLHSHVAERGAEAETMPFSVQDISDLFLKKLVLDYDHVFCLTVTKSRSQVYDNAMQASYAILNEYKPIRAAAGLNTPFALRVMDTQNLFAAQGITAVEAVRMIQAGEGVAKIRARLDNLAINTHGYMVPRDLMYLRTQTRLRGDKSVSLFSATLGSALDIKPVLYCNRGETRPVAKIRTFEAACRRLFDLMTKTMCLSFGGELEEMRLLPGYQSLVDTCRQHGVEVYESVMSLTGMIKVGKGSLAMGFASDPHDFKD